MTQASVQKTNTEEFLASHPEFAEDYERLVTQGVDHIMLVIRLAGQMKKMREEAGVTMEKMAELLGVPLEKIQGIEKEIPSEVVNLSEIFVYARVCGMSVALEFVAPHNTAA